MDLIKFDNVSFSYETEDENGNPKTEKVLENFNFSIEEGSFVAILGHNGSGKSTVAKLTNGILFADEGTVTDDSILARDDDTIYDIRKTVGMVFQNPDNQMVATIIEDDIAFGPENVGVPREEIIERVNSALEAVGMSEYRTRTASKLSGGQKQRIAIAGVLAMRPDILILDESTSMLDPNGRKDVMGVAKSLNEQGITVINITHNMEEAALADRIIVLRKGRIAIDGTPREVFSSGILEACGLTLPPVSALSRELALKGFAFDGVVIDEKELVEKVCLQLK
mgnify:CR=1 FL=1